MRSRSDARRREPVVRRQAIDGLATGVPAATTWIRATDSRCRGTRNGGGSRKTCAASVPRRPGIPVPLLGMRPANPRARRGSTGRRGSIVRPGGIADRLAVRLSRRNGSRSGGRRDGRRASLPSAATRTGAVPAGDRSGNRRGRGDLEPGTGLQARRAVPHQTGGRPAAAGRRRGPDTGADSDGLAAERGGRADRTVRVGSAALEVDPTVPVDLAAPEVASTVRAVPRALEVDPARDPAARHARAEAARDGRREDQGGPVEAGRGARRARPRTGLDRGPRGRPADGSREVVEKAEGTAVDRARHPL